MPLKDLTILILEQIGAVAMQNPRTPSSKRRAVFHLEINAFATRLYADDPNIFIV